MAEILATGRVPGEKRGRRSPHENVVGAGEDGRPSVFVIWALLVTPRPNRNRPDNLFQILEGKSTSARMNFRTRGIS